MLHTLLELPRRIAPTKSSTSISSSMKPVETASIVELKQSWCTHVLIRFLTKVNKTPNHARSKILGVTEKIGFTHTRQRYQFGVISMLSKFYFTIQENFLCVKQGKLQARVTREVNKVLLSNKGSLLAQRTSVVKEQCTNHESKDQYLRKCDKNIKSSFWLTIIISPSPISLVVNCSIY